MANRRRLGLQSHEPPSILGAASSLVCFVWPTRQAEKKFKEGCSKVEADIQDWAAFLVLKANDEKDVTVRSVMHQEHQRHSEMMSSHPVYDLTL